MRRKRARTARGRVVVRPRWPGEDDTGGSSPDPNHSDPYSSADEASHAGWGGALTHDDASFVQAQNSVASMTYMFLE